MRNMPFERRPEPSEKPDLDREQRALQLNLIPRWKEQREITTERLRETGFKGPEKADLERYHQAKQEHGMMRMTEEGTWAEYMFLEGADIRGVTGIGPENPRDKGARRDKEFDWFNGAALAYPAHDIDDVLQGLDAIVMLEDEDKPGLDHGLGIDICTNPEDFYRKYQKDSQGLAKGRLPRTRAYWADTSVTHGQEKYSGIDEPSPGKVPLLRATVYIPRELVAEFRDEGTGYARATHIMKNLGPFVMRQLSDQLSIQALTFLGHLDTRQGRTMQVLLQDVDRMTILSELEKASRDASHPETAAMATDLLPVLRMVWEAEEELGELNPQLAEKLPFEIRQLRHEDKRKTA